MTRPVDLTLDPEPFRDEVLAVLRANLSRLADGYGVRDLALFGSLARGEATETSDVDLIVEFEPDWITLTSFLCRSRGQSHCRPRSRTRSRTLTP